MRTESGGRETGRDGEHERGRQIEIQKEREIDMLEEGGRGCGVGGGGHQHTEAVCGLPSSSGSKNRGEKKQ